MSGSPAHSPELPTWGPHDYRLSHQPLLGTFVEVRIPSALDATTAAMIDRAATTEMVRLQSVFSAFDRSSELERWKRGEVPIPSEDFSRAMQSALDWQLRSEGRFNTAAGVVTQLWMRAEVTGTVPTEGALAAAASSIAQPRFAIDEHGRPHPVGDCSGINLNAFVKGWIVDRASESARTVAPSTDILVNAGGDLRHAGSTPIRIGIENPLRPYDNEPPVSIVRLCNAGLATSGRARRGFRIDGAWYSHIVDPRSGHTEDHHASISVIAPDAATADVLATVAGLMTADEALSYTQALGCACFLIDPDGSMRANSAWVAVEESRR